MDLHAIGAADARRSSRRTGGAESGTECPRQILPKRSIIRAPSTSRFHHGFAPAAGTCLVEARYANRSRISCCESVSSCPSGIIEVVDGLIASMSSRGTTIRSLAVWMTSDASFCSRMIPEISRPSVVATIRQRVVAAHGGTRVQDVFQDVVGIGPVRAGQLGADVAAGVIKLVARQAGAVEDGPASRQSRPAAPGPRRAATCTWPGERPWFSTSAGPCPRPFRAARDAAIAEGLQLPGDRDAHVAPGNLPAPDGLEQRQRPRRAGGQRRDRIVTLGRDIRRNGCKMISGVAGSS